MRVPLSWLRELVDFDASPEALAERLTFSGTEVESIRRIGSELKGVVVAEIRSVDRHPSADRLRVCRVSAGAEEITVVCGATNFVVGDRVALATVGAELPGGMQIREATLRGVRSFGMLCAEDELGLSEDHSGILVVPRDVPVGVPLADALGLPDVVLNIEVTWNRPDCLCLIGMAREVGALFGSHVKLPEVDFAEGLTAVEALARVNVEDFGGCPRYTARVLQGVRIGPSPAWMQRRLALCGMRPINNVVDITNYVMLECGQPLHAFDLHLLSGPRIVVRRAREAEAMTTLDGLARALDPRMLVIADAERPVALAGVMGGAGSEIRDQTHDVLLESAAFGQADIRYAVSRLGMATESSYRFERGTDWEGAEWASRRAARLMWRHAGSLAARGVIDVHAGRPERRRVTCRFERVRDLLGTPVTDGQVVSILESLDLPVRRTSPDVCEVEVPSFRPDIEIDADVIEEVARVHGLDRVAAAPPASRIVSTASDERARAVAACRDHLAGLGLSEIMNYSFLAPAVLDAFRTDDAAARVALPNPVSADYSVLRNSLVPQMVDTLGRNLARQNAAAALFEMGRVFAADGKGNAVESERVCVGLMGPVGRVGPAGKSPVAEEEAFLWMKGIVEELLRRQRVPSPSFTAGSWPYGEEGWAVSILSGGRPIGSLGLVHQAARRRWRLTEPVAVTELDLEPLVRGLFVQPALEAVPAYPSVSRDVAVVADDSIRHEAILRVIASHAPRELTGVTLFDVFRGRSLGEGKRSLAYSLVFRSQERTLTDEEANRYHETIKGALKRELGVSIRDS